MVTISITELRKQFDEYMQRIKSGEVIVITKYGKPIAQFMPAQEIDEEQKTYRFEAKKEQRER